MVSCRGEELEAGVQEGGSTVERMEVEAEVEVKR